MGWILVTLFCLIIAGSIAGFIIRGTTKSFSLTDTRFSMELFITLLVIYIIVIVGFAAIYFILSLEGVVLVEHNELNQVSFMNSFINSFYFSGVTLLTIGYGDIVPIGIGRMIAIIEALIGYILPAAFILKIAQFQHSKRENG